MSARAFYALFDALGANAPDGFAQADMSSLSMASTPSLSGEAISTSAISVIMASALSMRSTLKRLSLPSVYTSLNQAGDMMLQRVPVCVAAGHAEDRHVITAVKCVRSNGAD